MAIGNIVCRSGVGPTATIPLFVTHGLGAGVEPPGAPSDGGWITRHVEDYHKRKRRLKDEVNEKQELLAQIQAAMEPQLAQEQKQQASTKSRAQFYPSLELQEQLKQISLLNMQLQGLSQQLAQLELMSRKLPDDEEALLMLMG